MDAVQATRNPGGEDADAEEKTGAKVGSFDGVFDGELGEGRFGGACDAVEGV